jgi:hypothetical protein
LLSAKTPAVMVFPLRFISLFTPSSIEITLVACISLAKVTDPPIQRFSSVVGSTVEASVDSA